MTTVSKQCFIIINLPYRRQVTPLMRMYFAVLISYHFQRKNIRNPWTGKVFYYSI